MPEKLVIVSKGETVAEKTTAIQTAEAIDFTMFEEMAEVGNIHEGGVSKDMHVIGSEVAQFGKALNGVSHRQAKRPKEVGVKQTEHDLETVGSVMKSFFFG